MGIWSLLFLVMAARTVAQGGVRLAPRATPTTSTSTTSRLPLTAGLTTPPPECSSLTIAHNQRAVHLYQGCVGLDESCCLPLASRLQLTFSPGHCPPGYITRDAHVGLDRLAMDTIEWEATCVPEYESLLHALSAI
jgi:hypothetical protein